MGTGSKTLTYSGEYAKGYNVGGTAGSEWLYLVEGVPEELLADYEKVYTATKVSVSDTEKVNTGAKIIIYARQWKNKPPPANNREPWEYTAKKTTYLL